MKLSVRKNINKCLILLLTLASLTNPIFASYGGEGTKKKAEKMSKYRTQELINYVNLTIYYLYSAEKKNERHVILFKSCQKLLNSNKKTVKGKDKKNLTACTNLMNMGIYKNESSVFDSDSSEKNTKPNGDARREEEAKARREEEARREAEAKARREAEAKARREEEAKARREEEARREAEAKARREEEARREAEAKARREEEARREAEAKARREADAKARRELDAKRREEAKARREADAKARREFDAKRREEAIKSRSTIDFKSRSTIEFSNEEESNSNLIDY